MIICCSDLFFLLLWIKRSSVCPRSLDPFYIVNYGIKFVKASWTPSSRDDMISTMARTYRLDADIGIYVFITSMESNLMGLCTVYSVHLEVYPYNVPLT